MAWKTGNVLPLHDSVVVEEETLDPRQVREVVHLPDFVVREVDGVELATTLYKTLCHRWSAE